MAKESQLFCRCTVTKETFLAAPFRGRVPFIIIHTEAHKASIRSVSSQHDGRHLQLPTTRWTLPHFPIPSERKRHKEHSRSSFQTGGHCRSSRAANSLTDWISSAVPFVWLKYAKFVLTTFRSALPASWRCATDAHSLLLRHCFRLRLAFVAFPTVSPSSSSRS